VGSDIGGFIESPSGELYIRWLQLGIFHAFCRTHSSGDHGDQEPWSFGEEYTALAKKFIELRYQLLPYLYTTFWQYVNFGTPMLRPLVFLDQEDSETYLRMAEFSLGDNLLICPITQAEVDGRWLYLPKGQWYYYWNDLLETGGKEVWAEARLDRIPLYVRAGAVLPFYPVQQYVGEKKIEELTLHVYFLDGSLPSMLYEDRGDGYEYESGQATSKTFRVTGTPQSLAITQTQEGAYRPGYQTYKVMIHGLPFTIGQADADGAALTMDEEEVLGEQKIQVLRVHTDFQYLSLAPAAPQPEPVKAEPKKKA
jgi:alpha-glucosidase